MKGLRNIFAYMLVLIFLVPATGFYYTRHTCLHSGEVHLVIDDHYACCEKHGQSIPESPSSCCMDLIPEPGAALADCCAVEESASPCCINERNYIKSEEAYTSPERTEIPPLEVFQTAPLNTIDLFQNLKSTASTTAHSPPFALSAVDILHKHAVLIL